VRGSTLLIAIGIASGCTKAPILALHDGGVRDAAASDAVVIEARDANESTGDASTFDSNDGQALDASAAMDASAADAEGLPDASMSESTLVYASSTLAGLDRFKVSEGWMTWIVPSAPELRAASISGTSEYVIGSSSRHYDRFGLEVVWSATVSSENGFRRTLIPSATSTLAPWNAPCPFCTGNFGVLASDGASVYFPGIVGYAEIGSRIERIAGIWRLPIDGTCCEESNGPTNGPVSLVATEDALYQIGVERCGVLKSRPRTSTTTWFVPDAECDLLGDRIAPSSFAVFLSDLGANSHRFVAIFEDGRTRVISSGTGREPTEIAVGRTHVYWREPDGVKRTPLGGRDPVEIVPWIPATGVLAYDAGYLYWVVTSSVAAVYRARVD
jgi:hypothetical protein